MRNWKPDLIFDKITSKRIKIPVVNNCGGEFKFRRNESIGAMTPVESKINDSQYLKNIHQLNKNNELLSSSVINLDTTVRKQNTMIHEHFIRLKDIVENYNIKITPN